MSGVGTRVAADLDLLMFLLLNYETTFDSRSFFLSKGLGLAVEKSGQVIVVVQLIVTGRRF